MIYDDKQLLERVRRRVYTSNDRNHHEIPLFREEWDLLIKLGEIKPSDEVYKNFRIRKTWES